MSALSSESLLVAGTNPLISDLLSVLAVVAYAVGGIAYVLTVLASGYLIGNRLGNEVAGTIAAGTLCLFITVFEGAFESENEASNRTFFRAFVGVLFRSYLEVVILVVVVGGAVKLITDWRERRRPTQETV